MKDIAIRPKNKLQVAIAEVAVWFNFSGTNAIDRISLGHILRLLGCAATEKDVQNIFNATESKKPDYVGTVPIQTLIVYLADLLMQEKMKPATTQQLLEAFQILDPDRTGYVDMVYFRHLMLTVGEPLTEAEVDNMLKLLVDPRTGLLPYEYFLSKLTHKDLTIYHLAKEVLNDKGEALRREKEEKAKVKRYFRIFPSSTIEQ